MLNLLAVPMLGLMASSAHSAALSITNAGFEADSAPVVGATGWTITSGGTDFFTTTTGAPDSAVDPDSAFEGSNWLTGNRLAAGAGSSNNPQTIVQLIDISGDSALVDLGTATVGLNFMFADNDPLDDGSVNISFFSDLAGTIPIGTALNTGILAETNAPGGDNTPADWEARNLTGAVPALARSLQIEIVNNRLGGSAGNTHFDDFSGSVVPEPSAALLGLLGALGLLRRRR